MKQHNTLVKEGLKRYPYLKRLKPYAYYPYDWLKEKDGEFYKQLHECRDKPIDEVLALVKEYSMVNYCKQQFDCWPDIEGFSYADSVEADAYGLFTLLSDEAQKRIREDLARLRAYEEQADDTLLVDNCLI